MADILIMAIIKNILAYLWAFVLLFRLAEKMKPRLSVFEFGEPVNMKRGLTRKIMYLIAISVIFIGYRVIVTNYLFERDIEFVFHMKDKFTSIEIIIPLYIEKYIYLLASMCIFCRYHIGMFDKYTVASIVGFIVYGSMLWTLPYGEILVPVMFFSLGEHGEIKYSRGEYLDVLKKNTTLIEDVSGIIVNFIIE